MTLNIRAHRSNLSRRLGPVFAEAALEAQEGIKTGQEAPQKASPIAAPQLGTYGPSACVDFKEGTSWEVV